MSLTDDHFSMRCPNCNATYAYSSSSLNPEGQVRCQNCGRWIKVEGQTVTVAPADLPEETYVPYEKRPEETGMIIVKLWGHGFAFSLLSSFITIIFVITVSFLAYAGGIIGIALSFIFLAVMLGGVNIGIASLIWNLKLKSDTQSVLAQGGMILLILLTIGGLILLPLVYFAYPILLLLEVGVLPFIYGYIFRSIALNFQIVVVDTAGQISLDHRIGICPHCGARYAYSLASRDEQGQVKCQNCLQEFALQVGPEPM